MKTPIQFAVLCLSLLSFRANATTYYVDINNPNPTPPYTSWGTAATNIQDAISETVNGDLILVNPGVYQSGGYTAPNGAATAVDVTNAITIQSVDGPAATWVNGSNTMGCIYLANGATLIGFTLTNGTAINGGGAYCASTAGTIISNCVITANTAANQGGGTYQGTLYNCAVSRNFVGSSFAEGGGAYDAVLINCMIVGNSIFGGEGAGVYICNVTNTVIAENSQLAIGITREVTDGGGAYRGNLDHCNIVGNSATLGGGAFGANLVNCIDYFNIAYTNNSTGPLPSNYLSCTINYSCTAPATGFAAITGDPQLASISHISLSSPCRGVGQAGTTGGVDIDGNPWVNPPSIGCFEPYPGIETGTVTVAISTPYTNWVPGFALNLQANISGPVYSNVWNFGDGTFGTNETFIFHKWSVPGTYPVTLTTYNDSNPGGIIATQIVFVTVPSVYYVNLNSLNPVPPYITWATAAVAIQDAVGVATPGSLVLVTNGPTAQSAQNGHLTNNAAFYSIGAGMAPDHNLYRVVITNAITVQSVSGPASTYIWGPAPNGFVHCVYLTNGAILSGFTITNDLSGASSYGKITATPTNTVITNCIMAHYVAANSGTFNNCSFVWYSISSNGTLNSCIISNSSSVLGGVLSNCILVNNTNSANPGGAAIAGQGSPLLLNNCLISNNFALGGGGVYNSFNSGPTPYTNCILNNCTLIRNFAQQWGGGAYGAELNNCLIISNVASEYGGGGAEGGLLNNCLIIGNQALGSGGVDGSRVNAILNNCTLAGNFGGGAGGGAGSSSALGTCVLNQCILSNNIAGQGGGAWGCFLNQCILSNNIAGQGGGVAECVLNNCLIISNTASVPSDNINPALGGGAYVCALTNCILAYNVSLTNGGGAYQSTLVNCTVVANSASLCGGAMNCTNYNSILYYNSGGDFYADPPTYIGAPVYSLNYCCASVVFTNGFRNITNAPLFVNLAGGDYHLQSSSPCINSGNNAYISSATDFDGNPRIAGGTVDIGAYEYQTPVSQISYAWLEQYGLPIVAGIDTSYPADGLRLVSGDKL